MRLFGIALKGILCDFVGGIGYSGKSAMQICTQKKLLLFKGNILIAYQGKKSSERFNCSEDFCDRKESECF